MFLDICTEAKFAKVVLVDKHPKTRARPIAMDTIELEKLGVRLLKMSAKRVMTAAEKLYTRGLISYPRFALKLIGVLNSYFGCFTYRINFTNRKILG